MIRFWILFCQGAFYLIGLLFLAILLVALFTFVTLSKDRSESPDHPEPISMTTP